MDREGCAEKGTAIHRMGENERETLGHPNACRAAERKTGACFLEKELKSETTGKAQGEIVVGTPRGQKLQSS